MGVGNLLNDFFKKQVLNLEGAPQHQEHAIK